MMRNIHYLLAAQVMPISDQVNWHHTIAFLLIAGIILLFSGLAIYSNMLRDEVNDCDAFEAQARELKKKHRLRFIKSDNPFSLSRVQLAVWTVIIACSYIYLQLCMPDCTVTGINQTALVLMGLSAAVTASGSLMDKREIQNGMIRHQNAPSMGFFTDILSDEQGISIHRFQHVVWTAIAMLIYVNKVYAIRSGCALPDLDETLLVLTGISSATYLAVKTQENLSPVEGAVTTPVVQAVAEPGTAGPESISTTATPAVAAIVSPLTGPVVENTSPAGNSAR